MASKYEWTFDVRGTQDTQKLSSAIGELTTHIKKLTSVFSSTQASTRTFSQSAHNTTKTLGNMKQSAAGTASAMITLGNYTGGTAGSVIKMGAAVALGATKMGALGAAAVVLGGILRTISATITKIADVTKEAAAKLRDFGSEASQDRATLTAFFGENSDVAKSVEELGRATEYTQSQLATFATGMKRAGTEADVITTIMPDVIKSARASGDSLENLGKTAAISLKTFSNSSETAGDHLGNLTATANATATSTQALKQALINAGTGANMLSISGKETYTMLGLLADAGIEGSKAGRFLRIAFERLSAPTADAKRVLGELGINLKNLDLSNPAEWLKVFSDRLQNVKGADRIAMLKPLFGAASTAMSVLIDQADGFDAMANKIAAARAEVEKLSQLRSESLDAAIKGWDSALEGFWKTASKISDAVYVVFYRTIANALNKVSDELEKVSGKFTEAGNNLDKWIAVVKGGGLKDLFKGITESLKPEIEKIKQLAEAAMLGISELISAAVENVDWERLLKPLFDVGKKIGLGIAEGVAAGAKGTAKGVDEYIDEKAPVPVKMGKKLLQFGFGNYTKMMGAGWDAVQWLGSRKPEPKTDNLQAIYEDLRANGQSAKRATPIYDLDPMIRNYGSMPKGPDGRPLTAAQLQHDNKLREYAEWSKGQRALLDTGAGQQKSDVALNIEAAKKARDASDDMAPGIEKAKLAVIEMGKAMKQYLLEPFDAFKQMVLGIKEKFTGIIAGIRESRVSMKEQAGLIDEAGANKDRTRYAKDTFKDLKEQLDLAQTAEEKRGVYEQLSQQAFSLSKLTGDQSYAKEAVRFNLQEEEAAKDDREMKLKAAQIEKDAAVESIPVLERLFKNASTAGEKAEAGNQLQETLMKLGRADEAAKMQQQISQMTIAAAGEQMKELQGIRQGIDTLVEQNKEAGKQRDEQIRKMDESGVYTDPEAQFL